MLILNLCVSSTFADTVPDDLPVAEKYDLSFTNPNLGKEPGFQVHQQTFEWRVN